MAGNDSTVTKGNDSEKFRVNAQKTKESGREGGEFLENAVPSLTAASISALTAVNFCQRFRTGTAARMKL
jgi:hypothetical protein